MSRFYVIGFPALLILNTFSVRQGYERQHARGFNNRNGTNFIYEKPGYLG